MNSTSSQYTPVKLLYGMNVQVECYQGKKDLSNSVNILLYDCSIPKNWLTTHWEHVAIRKTTPNHCPPVTTSAHCSDMQDNS